MIIIFKKIMSFNHNENKCQENDLQQQEQKQAHIEQAQIEIDHAEDKKENQNACANVSVVMYTTNPINMSLMDLKRGGDAVFLLTSSRDSRTWLDPVVHTIATRGGFAGRADVYEGRCTTTSKAWHMRGSANTRGFLKSEFGKQNENKRKRRRDAFMKKRFDPPLVCACNALAKPDASADDHVDVVFVMDVFKRMMAHPLCKSVERVHIVEQQFMYRGSSHDIVDVITQMDKYLVLWNNERRQQQQQQQQDKKDATNNTNPKTTVLSWEPKPIQLVVHKHVYYGPHQLFASHRDIYSDGNGGTKNNDMEDYNHGYTYNTNEKKRQHTSHQNQTKKKRIKQTHMDLFCK